MSCMPTLWHQRAQILSVLRFPDLALGDAYKAYLLLRSVGPSRCPKSQDEIAEDLPQSPVFERSDPDEAEQPFQILEARDSHEIRLYPRQLKAIVKADICRILLLAGCLQDCISLLVADPWPEELQDGIKLLFQYATEAKDEELHYHQSNELEADEIEDALNFGSVYALPLPWVDPLSSQRSTTVRERLAAELEVLSGFTCVLKDLPSDVARSDDHDCNGLFANVDFPPNHTILSQDTVLAATNAEDPRCASCCQPLLKKQAQRSERCCNLKFCSLECQARANHLFHDPANCCLETETSDEASFTIITSSALQTESDPIRVTRLLLNRLLQLLVKEYRDNGTPPLEHRDVKTLHARLSPTKAVTFSFANDIQRPIYQLQSLGIDVFANQHFDTWIILDIIRRMKINQWEEEEIRPSKSNRSNSKHDQIVWWSGLTPGISLLNHSCKPNVEWKKDPKTSKMTIKTLREVRKGEELTISYISPECVTDDVHERQKLLADWFSRCRCEWCTEQFALSDAQSESAAKDGTDLTESFESLTTRHEPTLVEKWFGSALPVVRYKPLHNKNTDEDSQSKQPAERADGAVTPPDQTQLEPMSSPDIPLSAGRLIESLTGQKRSKSANSVVDKIDTDESSLFVRNDDKQHRNPSAIPAGHEVIGESLINRINPRQILPKAPSIPQKAYTEAPMLSQVSEAVTLDPSATPGSPPVGPDPSYSADRERSHARLTRARSGSLSQEGELDVQPPPQLIVKLKLRRAPSISSQSQVLDTKPDTASLERRESAKRQYPSGLSIIDLTHSDSSQSQNFATSEPVDTRTFAQKLVDDWFALRRPQQGGQWWSINKVVWHHMDLGQQIQSTHLGLLMETDAGTTLPKAERCDHCRIDGVDCIVYRDDIIRMFYMAVKDVPHRCLQCFRFNRRCRRSNIDPEKTADRVETPLNEPDRDRAAHLQHAEAQLSQRLANSVTQHPDLDKPLEDRYARAPNTEPRRSKEKPQNRRDEGHSSSYTPSKRRKTNPYARRPGRPLGSRNKHPHGYHDDPDYMPSTQEEDRRPH